MAGGGGELAEEAGAGVLALGVVPLAQFQGLESLEVGVEAGVFPVGGPGRGAALGRGAWRGQHEGVVGRGEEGDGEYAQGGVVDGLLVGLWAEELEAGPEGLGQGLAALDVRRGADQGEGLDAPGHEAGEFLGNHAAEGDADDVDLAQGGPADVVKELDDIASHFGGGVATDGGAAAADAAIVKDENRVFVAVGVAKVEGLRLPRSITAAEAHDELVGWRSVCE